MASEGQGGADGVADECYCRPGSEKWPVIVNEPARRWNAEQGAREFLRDAALIALIWPGGHIHYIKRNNHEPDEAQQPDCRGHFITAHCVDSKTNDERDCGGK